MHKIPLALGIYVQTADFVRYYLILKVSRHQYFAFSETRASLTMF